MGSKKDMNNYMVARADGLRLAYNCHRYYGIEGLKREKEFRDTTNIRVCVFEDGLNDAGECIKNSIVAAQNILWRATLYDSENFGKTRLTRVYKRVKQMMEQTDGIMSAIVFTKQLNKDTKKFVKCKFHWGDPVEADARPTQQERELAKYSKSKDKGFELGYKMIMNGELEEVRKMAMNRQPNKKMQDLELDRETHHVRDIWNEYCVMIWLNAIHKEGYGNDRLNRLMNRFEFKNECVTDGYVFMSEYNDLMKSIDGIDIDTTDLSHERTWTGVAK